MPRKNRWEYLNDFQKNESGKYEYKGKSYTFAGNESERKNAYLKLWLFLIATAACGIASGCLNGAGITNTFYVILPYIGEIACLFTLIWNHVKLLTKGENVKSYIYQSAHPKIPVAAMLLAFFAIIGFVLSFIFSVISGFADGALNAILYLIFKAGAASAALIYRNSFSRLEWVEI